jgi:hypothetical protein
VYEEEDQEDAEGLAPVFTGLHRPKLTWPGIDGRVFLVSILFAVGGAISGVGTKDLKTVALWIAVFFCLAFVTFVGGLVLARINPYFFDELSTYLMLRMERWSFHASDDAGDVFQGLKTWK